MAGPSRSPKRKTADAKPTRFCLRSAPWAVFAPVRERPPDTPQSRAATARSWINRMGGVAAAVPAIHCQLERIASNCAGAQIESDRLSVAVGRFEIKDGKIFGSIRRGNNPAGTVGLFKNEIRIFLAGGDFEGGALVARNAWSPAQSLQFRMTGNRFGNKVVKFLARHDTAAAFAEAAPNRIQNSPAILRTVLRTSSARSPRSFCRSRRTVDSCVQRSGHMQTPPAKARVPRESRPPVGRFSPWVRMRARARKDPQWASQN